MSEDYDEDNPYDFLRAIDESEDTFFVSTNEFCPEVIVKIKDQGYFLWRPDGLCFLTENPIIQL